MNSSWCPVSDAQRAVRSAYESRSTVLRCPGARFVDAVHLVQESLLHSRRVADRRTLSASKPVLKRLDRSLVLSSTYQKLDVIYLPEPTDQSLPRRHLLRVRSPGVRPRTIAHRECHQPRPVSHRSRAMRLPSGRPRAFAEAWPENLLTRREVCELVGSYGFNASRYDIKRRGLQFLLDWLEDQPGNTWQERWLASGADAAGRDWAAGPAEWLERHGLARARTRYLTAALARDSSTLSILSKSRFCTAAEWRTVALFPPRSPS